VAYSCCQIHSGVSFMRLALFGLSANPPTGLFGHQGIVRALVQCGRYDEVWVIPVFSHMFAGKDRSLETFTDRMQMSQICFEPESSDSTIVRVSSLEEQAALYYHETHGPEYRVGTLDVVDYLRSVSSSGPTISELTFVLGADTFNDLLRRKWKGSERLLKELKFHVFSRESLNLEELCVNQESELKLAEKVVIEQFHGGQNISSTTIRTERLWDDTLHPSIDPNVLNPGVALYIREHKLYH